MAQTERFIERFRYKASKARQVQSRVKALEKLDRIVVDEPETRPVGSGSPSPGGRRAWWPNSTTSPLATHPPFGVLRQMVGRPSPEVQTAAERIILRNVTFDVERGRKVALIGPNGAGKTTLVRLLTGEMPPLAGRVGRGTNVDLSHFDQLQAEVLDDRRTGLEEFKTVPAWGSTGVTPAPT
ncbi:MAG: hypothetical protein Ct9H300mP12_17270 [Acidimicrobiales bacterium]|nr:MAG: hypothetical protein Ct9H300mP12_17270 [Acidimicrobiales bacterium]